MATMGVCVLSAAFASNQAMSVILPARLMEAKRKETGTSPEDFAGVISDSGVAAAGIIPWNVMAVICAQSLQLSPLTYAPYSFLLLALPVMGGLHTVATAEDGGVPSIRDEYQRDYPQHHKGAVTMKILCTRPWEDWEKEALPVVGSPVFLERKTGSLEEQ